MKDLPNGFEINGLVCYRSKDLTTFFFIPGEPTTEVSQNGSSTLMILVSDVGAILQMGTQLAIDSNKIELLKKAIIKKFPELDVLNVRINPAPILVEGATLYLGDGSESVNWEDLKTERTSGFLPFNAIFNVQLDAKGKAKALSAINGNKGFLKVVYKVSLPIELEAQTSISGDVSTYLTNIRKEASIKEALEKIDFIISKGDLKVENNADEDASDELRRNVNYLAKEKAANMLLKIVYGSSVEPNKARIEVSASKTENDSIKLERSTDIGTWFPGGRGVDHIQFVEFTITEPEKEVQTKKVKLGFDPQDLPIVFIQVELGEAKAKLAGPDFDQVSISTKSSGDLFIRTNYTDGGSAFEIKRPSTNADGWILAPEDLGLAKIVLDGSKPKESGSKDARVHIHYRPSSNGTEDDRTIYLRRDKWIERWYIITRSLDLAGLIEYDWRETTSDGSVIMHPAVKTDKTRIGL